MRRTLIRLLLWVFWTLWLCGAPATLAASSAQAQRSMPEKARVLYINSYMPGYSWSDGIFAGLRETLAEAPSNIDLQVEYLDAKRYPLPQLQRKLRELLEFKFQGTRFDVLVVSDNDAFNFAMEYGRQLFPGVPLVFCGVNDYHPEMLQGRTDVTGVAENFDADGTLEVAKVLHRDRGKLLVIGDSSVTSQAIEKQVRAAEPNFAGRLAFQYARVDTPAGLEALLNHVADDTIIYLMPFYMQRDGHILDAEGIIRFAAARTSCPIYTNWDFMLGDGIVGGKLLSGKRHGATAARLVLRILSGEPVGNIPVLQTPDDQFMFDAKVLEQFGIDPTHLPGGSRLINEKKPFYELEKPVFWVIMLFLASLLVILFLLAVNIIKRRQMERKVTDQLHFLQLVMDTIPIPLYFRNTTGAYGLFNAPFEQWFCVKNRGTCSGECFSARCAGLASLADAQDDELLAAPGVSIYERQVRSVDGAHHDVLVHKATYRNARGDVEGLVGVLYDITDRKRAEEGLRESQAMLRTVLDTIPQLVYWKDRHNRYLGVNRAFARFFGLRDPADVLGNSDFQMLDSPEEIRLAEQLERKVMATAKPAHGVAWELDRGGAHLLLEVSKIPLLDHEGQVVGVLSTAEDVTAKRSLERQLLQSQKMEAIGTFVSGIAHDFNNILTTIINSAELALLDLPPEADTAKDIDRALAAARRGSQLVRQIHTYSRPRRARNERNEQFRAIDLTPVVTETLELVTASLPRNIRLQRQIDPTTGAAIADPTQIHQVLMNLCTNAFHALQGNGGEIVVGLARVHLDATEAPLMGLQAGQYARLWVSDNGSGIAPEIVDKIFDPFFTTKDKGEGTGLGLAVVQGIAKAHKGAVWVSSHPWEITTFEVFLPCADMPVAHPVLPSQAARQGSERVLFVEDDRDQLQAVPKSLERLGYRVVACHGASEALDVLAVDGGSFDLVVTDFDMPDMHGMAFSEVLAELRPSLPVIMVTGRPEALDSVTAAQNIRRVLLKPYSGRDLSGAIRDVLEN